MRIWTAAWIALALLNAPCASAQTAHSEEIFRKYPGCTTHGTGQLQGNYTDRQRIEQCTAGIDADAYDGQDLATFYFNRALLRFKLEDASEAQGDLAAALKAWPEIADTMMNMARAFAYHHMPTLAFAYLKAIETALPDSYILHFGRATVFLALRNLPSASSEIDKALALRPDGANTLSLKANIRAAAGDVDGALAAADRAVELSPKSGIAYNLSCYIRAVYNRDLAEKALPACNRAVELLPKSPNVLDSRGFVYLRLGRYEEAIADYNAAIAISNEPPPPSLYGRGIAEQKSGQKLSGEADINAAESIKPGMGKIFGTAAMLLE
jgi:tetratricopeptide (TPR) repeat protein